LLASGLVRTVRLSDCGDCLDALARCRLLERVEYLDLGVNYLGDAKAAELLRSEHVRGVRGLGLSFNGLTNGGVRAVLDLGPWPRLASLDLQGNAHLTGRGAIAIAHSRALPALEALDLRDNQVSADGLWALANSKALPHLADLGLSGNPLGDAGARSLASSPLLPRQLARTGTLDLRGAGLGPAGVQALVSGDHLRPVVVLNLNRNQIGDAGVIALSVADLRRLRELHLAANAVTDEGAAALATAPFFGRLRTVDFADNLLSPGGPVALMSSPYWNWRTVIDVSDNRPLTSLDDALGADDPPMLFESVDE
jgi:Ran GTPase-activating protein (RanGAP) involved in mRNA processing and transport